MRNANCDVWLGVLLLTIALALNVQFCPKEVEQVSALSTTCLLCGSEYLELILDVLHSVHSKLIEAIKIASNVDHTKTLAMRYATSSPIPINTRPKNMA